MQTKKKLEGGSYFKEIKCLDTCMNREREEECESSFVEVRVCVCVRALVFVCVCPFARMSVRGRQ